MKAVERAAAAESLIRAGYLELPLGPDGKGWVHASRIIGFAPSMVDTRRTDVAIEGLPSQSVELPYEEVAAKVAHAHHTLRTIRRVYN